MAKADQRSRGRPRKPNLDDPFDWLRFPPQCIRSFFEESVSNTALDYADRRQLNEEWRKTKSRKALQSAGAEGRKIGSNENARRADARRWDLWNAHETLIGDTQYSDTKVADILIAEGAFGAKAHRTLRRYIRWLRASMSAA
jgi:hypothetical protein